MHAYKYDCIYVFFTHVHFCIQTHTFLCLCTWAFMCTHENTEKRKQFLYKKAGGTFWIIWMWKEKKEKERSVENGEKCFCPWHYFFSFFFLSFLLFFISFQWKEVKSCSGPWHFWPSGQHSMKKLTTQVTCQSNFFHWMDTHIHTLCIPVSTIIIVTTIIVVVIIIRNLLL